jgi:hypothetical protein
MLGYHNDPNFEKREYGCRGRVRTATPESMELPKGDLGVTFLRPRLFQFFMGLLLSLCQDLVGGLWVLQEVASIVTSR